MKQLTNPQHRHCESQRDVAIQTLLSKSVVAFNSLERSALPALAILNAGRLSQ
jgi:hypothetical protein